MSSDGYFYDGQIRRFVTQFIRLVSNFYVQFGADSSGVTALQRVPVIYGDQSRQAAQILRNNSANTLSAVPAMAVYISGFNYDQSRLLDPSMVQTMSIRMRKFDPVTGTYTTQQGDAYTVERMMPAPYKLTLKLDIWTSNTEQKLQLLEQMSQLFNPSAEIQNTDNYIDWTSLSVVTLTDTNWDSRTVPTGGEEPYSIATMTFDLPIWISTSIKVKKLGVIQTIVNNINNLPDWSTLGQVMITPLQFGVIVNSFPNGTYTMKLVKADNIITTDQYSPTTVTDGPNFIWASLLEEYGTFRAGSSQIRVMQPNGSEVIGTIATHPTDPTLMLYTPFIDTLPTNTLSPVNAIIDPQTVTVNSAILTPTTGTRYLIINPVGNINNTQGALAWQGSDGVDLIANANDIIQYNGTHWVVSFDSQSTTTLQYCTNLTTGIQYQWQNQSWTKTLEGAYPAGEWGVSI